MLRPVPLTTMASPMRALALCLTLLASLLVVACGDDDDSRGGEGGTTAAVACVAGKQEECACAQGSKGYQACKADGSGFEACTCGAAGAGGSDGSSGGASGAADFTPTGEGCERNPAADAQCDEATDSAKPLAYVGCIEKQPKCDGGLAGSSICCPP